MFEHLLNIEKGGYNIAFVSARLKMFLHTGRVTAIASVFRIVEKKNCSMRSQCSKANVASGILQRVRHSLTGHWYNAPSTYVVFPVDNELFFNKLLGQSRLLEKGGTFSSFHSCEEDRQNIV